MSRHFGFAGDSRGFVRNMPYYAAPSGNLDYKYFDESLFPFVRNEFTTVAANTWSGYSQVFGTHPDADSHGPGPNKLGCSGFWLRGPGRWLTESTGSRTKRVQIVQFEGGTPRVLIDTIWHSSMMNATDNGAAAYYPVRLPPGKIWYRAMSEVANDPRSLQIFTAEKSYDVVGDKTSFECIGIVSNADGTAVEGGTSNSTWGAWTFIGTTTKYWSMMRPIRNPRVEAFQNKWATYEVGLGTPSSVKRLLRSTGHTQASENSFSDNQ